MLSNRARKIWKVLWNLYRHEAFQMDRRRFARIIGLTNEQIDAALTELEKEARIIVTEGLLQVIQPWEAAEWYVRRELDSRNVLVLSESH